MAYVLVQNLTAPAKMVVFRGVDIQDNVRTAGSLAWSYACCPPPMHAYAYPCSLATLAHRLPLAALQSAWGSSGSTITVV